MEGKGWILAAILMVLCIGVFIRDKIRSGATPAAVEKDYTMFWRYSDSFNVYLMKATRCVGEPKKDSAYFYYGKCSAYFDMEQTFK